MAFQENIEEILDAVLPVVPSIAMDEEIDPDETDDGDNYISRTGGRRPSLTHYDNKRSSMVDRYSWGDYGLFRE